MNLPDQHPAKGFPSKGFISRLDRRENAVIIFVAARCLYTYILLHKGGHFKFVFQCFTPGVAFRKVECSKLRHGKEESENGISGVS
jgi:hypothetical protein